MTHPAYKPMGLAMKVVLWFVVANAYAAAASLIVFPADTQATFFWSISPPINAGMFGALYLAAGTVVLYTVWRGQWEPARFLVVMVPAFTGMMLLSTLLHRTAFDQSIELAYWLLVYIVAPVAGIVFYLQHERGGANWQIVGQPIAPATRLAAVVFGAGAALFGVVAYLFPNLVGESWPWTISPFMVRVFVSWLSAFAVGLLWFGVEPDWSRLRPVAALLVGSAALMMLMLVVHRDDLIPASPALWLFVAGLIAIALLGAFFFWRQRELASREPRTAARRQQSAAG